MIAVAKEPQVERDAFPLLSAVGRAAAAELLPAKQPSASQIPAIPAWQAWLLVAWLVATSLAYVAITLGIWKS